MGRFMRGLISQLPRNSSVGYGHGRSSRGSWSERPDLVLLEQVRSGCIGTMDDASFLNFDESERRPLLGSGRALADRYALLGRFEEAIALGCGLWRLQKRSMLAILGDPESFYFTGSRRLAPYFIGAKNYDGALTVLKEVHSSLSPKHIMYFVWSLEMAETLHLWGQQKDAEIFLEQVSQVWLTLGDPLSRRTHIRWWKDMTAKGKSISADLYIADSSPIHRMFHYSPKAGQSRRIRAEISTCILPWRDISDKASINMVTNLAYRPFGDSKTHLRLSHRSRATSVTQATIISSASQH